MGKMVMDYLERFRKYSGKQVLVTWSGGLDSTAIMFALSAVGANVVTVTGGGNCVANGAIEEMVRDEIKQHINARHNTTTINTATIELHKRYKLGQIPIWLSTLSLSIPEGTDYIFMGYAMGDQANSYTAEIYKLWEAFGKFNLEDVKHPELVMPILQLCKGEVNILLQEALKSLKIDAPIDRLVWSCEDADKESGVFQRCNKCRSCYNDNRETGLGDIGLKTRFITYFPTLADYAGFMNLSPSLNLEWRIGKYSSGRRAYSLYLVDAKLKTDTLIAEKSLIANVDGDVVKHERPTAKDIELAEELALEGTFPMHYYLPLGLYLP